MADISNRLQQINTLICSGVKANKSLAYSSLLQIQQASNTNHTSIDALAEFSRDSIHPIVSDTQDEDEEIAAQALKCLGFIIYHSSIVAAIPAKEANFIFKSLAELISRTRLKSVCNLGVWCISIQQLDSDILAMNFQSLLLAVTRALNNPYGSLSTTFEAIQAITMLAAKLSDKMRESSNIWAPPIYRRLLSSDKRERDMSERCLLKIRSTILPPPLVLSKVLVKDMKESLLIGMDKLLSLGMKVQAIAAWGWFIRILGSHSMKNRSLVNNMLKIPERTFSDHDPQVQIASQVAWEGVIDALVHTPNLPCKFNLVKEKDSNQTVQLLNGNNCEIQANGFSKSIKLIMVPLVGVMLSKCDILVRVSCLNTWHYLLYKLESFVNSPSVIKLVLEPVLEAIFQLVPDNENLRLWTMCLSFLDDFLLAKCSHMDNDVTAQLCYKSEMVTSETVYSEAGERFWKRPIRWLPWNLNHLNFHLKMICVITSSASMETFNNENRTFAYDACQKLFKSVLKGLQLELKKPSANYDDVMFAIREILKFLRHLSDDKSGDVHIHHHLHYAVLHFIQAVTKELEPSILGSPLYEVELDLKAMDAVQSVNHTSYAQVLGVPSISHMDKVAPIIYLVVMYSLVTVRSTSKMHLTDCILKEMHKYFELVFSSFIPPNNLLAAASLVLYKNIVPSSLKIWIEIAKGLMESSTMGNHLTLKTKSETEGVDTICHFLSYPFVVCSSKKLCGSPLESLELESVVQVWNSLYGSVNTLQLDSFVSISFTEGLASMLKGCLDDQRMPGCGSESCSSCEDFIVVFLSIFVNIVTNLLNGLQISKRRSDRIMRKDSNREKSSFNSSSLRLAARFIGLLWIKQGKNSSNWLSRVFSALAQFVSCLHLKHEIFEFIEIISSPLLLWLTKMETLDESINSELQILWSKITSHLQKGCPSLVSDSAFLKLLAPLLEKTLDHPNPSISERTITFWSSSFGEHLFASYPQNLLPILHKLSRNGRIKLQKRCLWVIEQCPGRQENADPPFSHRVSATSINSSKRIQIMTTTNHDKQKEDTPTPNPKRKKIELTQHQKEVRQAQQGRTWDCGGHGPGIRTYTSLDFSQVVDDSEESQDTQNLDSILEMARADN
ncbi:Rif1_N domain-containing protein [Cucumis melo var. makuwa]|uniref:Rif1_N domain-containing protein n=4 Tax=Cucumis melo TaxID=3656 RepID=A0A5A7U6Y2_CUCMM|nr:uncharacterized protein LOC103487420 isoform X1 [Cucumis melo]KAA0050127.1 Rif1_N domain-containing protein [Cucumis melo var. makuwa]